MFLLSHIMCPKIRTTFYTLTALGIIATANAALAESLSLRDAIDQAVERNPDVESLNEQVFSTAAKKRQTLAPNDPQVSVFYNDATGLTRTGTAASKVYQIAQPFAFPGKALVNYNAVSAQQKAVQKQRNAMKLQVANNVKQAYYQLALARKNLELSEELKEDYEEVLAIAKRRYETGSITQVDYLNAKAVIYSHFNDTKDFAMAEQNALVQLNILLGQPNFTEVETDVLHYHKKPKINPVEAEQAMLTGCEEIGAAQQLLAQKNSNYTLAKMSLLPDFQVVAGVNNYRFANASPYSGAGDNLRTKTIGLQMTVPLWAPINESQTISAAVHDKKAAKATLNSLIEQSRNALNATLQSISILEAKLANYEDHLLPIAQQSFKLALINYSNGKIDFQALSQSANSRRATERDYNNTVINYLMAYANYGQLIGQDLSAD